MNKNRIIITFIAFAAFMAGLLTGLYFSTLKDNTELSAPKKKGIRDGIRRQSMKLDDENMDLENPVKIE